MKNVHLRELASKVEKATKKATKMAYACLEVDLKQMQDNTILVFQVVCGPFDVSHMEFSFMSEQSMDFDIKNPCMLSWNTFTLHVVSGIHFRWRGGNVDEGVEVNNNRV
ncbi:hypothetical protein V6N13_148241 [Hibiscus sabdariffa]|uniref:Uncharacterized protein n=1 Tax=Hibiscus sabdariffa TaxID=183260 RepID=A0ABR2TYC1_9ROSI